MPSGFGGLVSVLGSLVVWWCGGPRRLCLSEILLLVLSGGHESESKELSTELGDLPCLVGLVLLRSGSERWRLARHSFP